MNDREFDVRLKQFGAALEASDALKEFGIALEEFGARLARQRKTAEELYSLVLLAQAGGGWPTLAFFLD